MSTPPHSTSPRDPAVLVVAFVVPLQGPTGIYGPSCLACGELAVEQLNATTGIAGRRIELVVVDAGRAPDVVADEVGLLVDSGRVDAIAGWHISAVRQAITSRVGGRVVYAYAAMHEGRDDTPGVFMLGERPVNQLLPSMRWMGEQTGARRWAIVGNDYVFPRVTGATVRRAMHTDRSEVVAEHYVELGTRNFAPVLERLRASRADAVVMLLMGQDAVHFNRQFGAAGLSSRLHRLSPAVEENTLLASGARANENLFAAAAYFENLNTSASSDLRAAYYARFGEYAPMLNAVGESCYEAIVFLAGLGARAGSLDLTAALGVGTGHDYDSPRGRMRLDGNLMNQDVYLAVAQGLEFSVQEQVSRTG